MGKNLDPFGLTTREELQAKIEWKNHRHRLVDVFARYYAKFRENDLGYIPELPRKFSPQWEEEIKQEILDFRGLDLESVGRVLDACGFGTEHWGKIKDIGLDGLDTLIHQHIGILGSMPPDSMEELISEKLLGLLQRRPQLMNQFSERFDEKTGRYNPTDDEMHKSQAYLHLKKQIKDAKTKLRKFRRVGRKAIDQLKIYEKQIEKLKSKLFERRKESGVENEDELPSVTDFSGHSESDFNDLFQEEIGQGSIIKDQASSNGESEDDRGLQDLDYELKMREHKISELEDKVETLEFQMESTQILEGVDFSDPSNNGNSEAVEVGNDADFQAELQQRDHTIGELEEKIQQLEFQAQSSEIFGADEAEPAANTDSIDVTLEGIEIKETAEGALPIRNIQFHNQLGARDQTIRTPEEKVAKLEYQLQSSQSIGPSDLDGQAEQVVQLKKTLHIREQAIENLKKELGKKTQVKNEVDELRIDLKVKDYSIRDLKDQIVKFDNQLESTRKKFMAEVSKLAALAKGEVQLKPSSKLDDMDANELLDYAQGIADDVNVRRHSLEEGIQRINSIKNSYEESKQGFENQQKEMEQQLEQMRSELERYAQRETEEEGKKKAQTDEETEEIIRAQREQLQFLAGRIKDLLSSNKSLQHANQNMYTELEAAVHKLMPLRRQIKDLQKSREALDAYIREKHDRTFTLKKLQLG